MNRPVEQAEERRPVAAKHPDAIAWGEWLASDEGQRCAEPTGLYAPSNQRTYLENRLWRAFMAGTRAARERQGEGT